VATLPKHLWRSLTWDQGSEMHYHHQFTLATNIPVYFCDPHSPWQRGSKRKHQRPAPPILPKGTDLAVHIADQLNGRPRETLNGDTLATLLTTN
jgi:IS30 family transposase